MVANTELTMLFTMDFEAVFSLTNALKMQQLCLCVPHLCADRASVRVHGCDRALSLGTAASAQPHLPVAVSAASGAHGQALTGRHPRYRQLPQQAPHPA